MPAGFVECPYDQIYEEEEHAHRYGGGGLACTFKAYYGYGRYGGCRGEQEYDRRYGNQGVHEKVYPHFADCGRTQRECDAAQGLIEGDCEGFGYGLEFFVQPFQGGCGGAKGHGVEVNHVCQYDDPDGSVQKVERILQYVAVCEWDLEVWRVEKHDETQAYNGSRNRQRGDGQHVCNSSAGLELLVFLNQVCSQECDESSQKCRYERYDYGIFECSDSAA